jgi:hypothetical protein
MRAVVWLLLACAACVGCLPTLRAFTCSDNASCGGAGICQPNRLCSFPDATCPSGQRYGALDGTSSGQCVGEAPIDAAQCFGTFVRVCFSSAAAIPTAPKMLGDVDIDTDATDATSHCNQENDQAAHYCVVAGPG